MKVILILNLRKTSWVLYQLLPKPVFQQANENLRIIMYLHFKSLPPSNIWTKMSDVAMEERSLATPTMNEDK